jgi:hypothetical protein
LAGFTGDLCPFGWQRESEQRSGRATSVIVERDLAAKSMQREPCYSGDSGIVDYGVCQ